jgi:hypothetical protein
LRESSNFRDFSENRLWATAWSRTRGSGVIDPDFLGKINPDFLGKIKRD